MKKIAFVNCYVGHFPWYFKLFLKSCQSNPSVDFYIFTDNREIEGIPENVKLIPFSLDIFNQLATQKLGFEIRIDKPYKLCDFKPAYGFLFQEYLSEYDFWGITDIDVIYGRIREFMTEELLQENDIICVRHDYITACCVLFKNSAYINTLFKKSKDYQMVFTSKKNYAFDETNFEHKLIIDRYDIFNVECEIEAMQHVVLKEEQSGKLKSHFDFLICEGTDGKLKWSNGVFSYNSKLEILLYHLINYKENIFCNKEMIWNKVPDTFYIDKYNYRSKKTLLIQSQVLYQDHVIPFLWNLRNRIDMFLSSKIFKKKLKNLQTGRYFYYLSKMHYVVGKNINEENYIQFDNSDELVLFRMMFNKKYFFAENNPKVFKLGNNENGSYRRFDLIYHKGHSNAYKLEINSI